MQHAKPDLARRCLFVLPEGVHEESQQHLFCQRPLNIPEILRDVLFLTAAPLAEDDALLTG